MHADFFFTGAIIGVTVFLFSPSPISCDQDLCGDGNLYQSDNVCQLWNLHAINNGV